MTEIAVWGLGKMGLPLACVFANAGFHVTGIDVDEKRVAAVNKGEATFPGEPGLDKLLASALEKGLFTATVQPARADIHIIIVPIELQDKQADLSILKDVCEKISKVLRRGDIVVLESTAPPGTCEDFVTPILERTGLKKATDFGVAHCPERTMAGTALEDITKKYPKIIGASDLKTGEALKNLYSRINEKGVILVRDTRTAEAVKVFEGIYRDVNIALANELAIYCEEAGIDILDVISAANTQPYCHLHRPGAGVGGHCIPVYPYFIMNEKTKLIKTARELNEYMPYHVVDLTEEMLRKHKISLPKAKIMLLGIAFRSGVRETRNSPFFVIRDELERRGAAVYAYDPLYEKEEVEKYGVTYSTDFVGIDAVLILTDYTEFAELDWEVIYKKGVRVVVDGRNLLDMEQMKLTGLDYVGIGRIPSGRD